MKLEKVPLLVFWESTKACPLLCRHCRANAILKPLPDELNTKEAKLLINQISEFENPKPVFIITGGDPLMRKDLFELIEYARSLGIAVGLSPAVSENLNEKVLLKLKNLGVKIISVSLDGASKETHEYLRQVNGIYEMTINAIKMLVDFGFQVQVNTLIWKGNLNELPYLVKLLLDLNVRIWEVFFLIITGRAGKELDIEINEYEDVVQFLVDVSRYSIQIRTVEAPFYRRAKLERLKGKNYSSDLYCKLIEKLKELLGEPKCELDNRILPTRDGFGVIFVSYNGTIFPSGFLPYPLGNIKKDHLVKVYQEHPILKKLREAKLNGICGNCIYNKICGGSRARAYAQYGDLFADDPACILTYLKWQIY